MLFKAHQFKAMASVSGWFCLLAVGFFRLFNAHSIYTFSQMTEFRMCVRFGRSTFFFAFSLFLLIEYNNKYYTHPERESN